LASGKAHDDPDVVHPAVIDKRDGRMVHGSPVKAGE
jgi:hypothetical protein